MAVVVGEEAHIIAKSSDGPRGVSPLSGDQRDDYSNLILLCPTDHALIDKAPNEFSVDQLLDIKARHEVWVRATLGAKVNLPDEKWAGLVDQLSTMLGLNSWSKDISPLFSGGTASIALSVDGRLRDSLRWIVTRPWPSGQGRLKKLVIEIGAFLNELLGTFDQYSEPNKRGDRLVYEAFYKIPMWDEELHNSLLTQYGKQREYMSDLALERTRYINHFIDVVRVEIDPDYREEEGYVVLSIEGAPLRFDTYVPKFTSEEVDYIERTDNALTEFETARNSRATRFHW